MDVRTILRGAMLLITAAMVGCADRGPVTPVPANANRVIDSPESFAAEYFERNLGQGTLTAYHDDLDRDGVAEMLIATSAGAGNAGSPHLAFKRTHGGYILLGELFTHPRAYRVLPPTVEGGARLVVYHRLGGSEGDIVWMVCRDGTLLEERRERVFPGDGGTDEGRRRYAEVFGE